MPVTLVHQSSAVNLTDTVEVDMSGSGGPVEGNKILLFGGSGLNGGNIVSVASTATTWVQKLTHSHATLGVDCDLWEGTVGAGAGSAITVTFAAAGDNAAAAAEYSGIGKFEDADAGDTGGSLVITPELPVATSAADSLVLAGYVVKSSTNVYTLSQISAPNPVSANTTAGTSTSLQTFDSRASVRHHPLGVAVPSDGAAAVAMIVSYSAANPGTSEAIRVQAFGTSNFTGAGPFSVNWEGRALVDGDLLVLALNVHETITISSVTQTGVTWTLFNEEVQSTGLPGVRQALYIGFVGASVADDLSIAVSAATQIAIVGGHYRNVIATTIGDITPSAFSVGTSNSPKTSTTAVTPTDSRIFVAALALRAGISPATNEYTAIDAGWLIGRGSFGGGGGANNRGAAIFDRAISVAEAGSLGVTTVPGASHWVGQIISIESATSVVIPPSGDAPSVTEPIAAIDDVSLRAINRLAEQFKG